MAQMKIDQVGLSAGAPGFARKDGKSDGSEVTLTDTVAGGTTLFEILWIDPSDTHALNSLLPTADPHVWKFTPSAGVTGGIRIRLTHTAPGGAITQQTRIFGIPDSSGNVPPVPGERSDPNAARGNETDAAVIDRCERNWPTTAFPAGNPFGWGGDLPKPGSGGGAGMTFRAITDLSNKALQPNSYNVLVIPENTVGDATFTLPDATACAGQSIYIIGFLIPPQLKLVDAAGAYILTPEQDAVLTYMVPPMPVSQCALRLTAGDMSAAFGVKVWIIEKVEPPRSEQRVIGVKVVTLEPLPANTLSSTQPYSLTANAGGSLNLAFNGLQMSKHDLVLVMWEGDETKNGLYVVNEPGDESHPWVLQQLFSAANNGPYFNFYHVTDLYFVHGDPQCIWTQNRMFFWDNPYNAPQTLKEFPRPLMVTTPGLYGGPLTEAVWPGGIAQIGTAGGEVTLQLPNPERFASMDGMRFGMQIVDGDGMNAITVDAQGANIYDLSGDDDTTAVINAARGTYVEWMYDAELSTWHIVSAHVVPAALA